MVILWKWVPWKEKNPNCGNLFEVPEMFTQWPHISSTLKEGGLYFLEESGKENSISFDFSIWCAFLSEKKYVWVVTLAEDDFFSNFYWFQRPHLLALSGWPPFPVHLMHAVLRLDVLKGSEHMNSWTPWTHSGLYRQYLDMYHDSPCILYALCVYHMDTDHFQCTCALQADQTFGQNPCLPSGMYFRVMSWTRWTIQ